MMIPSHLNMKKNVIFALLAFGLNIGLVFVSYRLIILQGGVQSVGVWSTLFAWTSLIRIGDVGMSSATVRFTAMYDIEQDASTIRDYIETGIISNFALFAVLAIGGYLIMNTQLASLIGPDHLEEAKRVLPAMFLGFFLMNFANIILGSMQGLHLGFLNSQLTVLGSFIQIIGVFLLVPSMGLQGMAWAQVIQYGLIAIAAWVVVRRRTRSDTVFPTRFKMSVFREMLDFSLKSQVANISNGLFEPLSKILVSHFGGLQVQGIYELAYKTLWLPRTAIISGVSAMIPTLTNLQKTDPAKVWPLYQKSVVYSTGAVLVISLALILASPLISWIWMGKVELIYTYFVAIFAVGIVFNAFGAGAYNLAIITGRLRHNIVINVLVLLGMGTVGAISGAILPVYAMIAVIAIAMAAGGLAVKMKNESLISRLDTGTPNG